MRDHFAGVGNMIAARHTFVFSKAHALAKRIPVEPNKKHAAHTVCERLVAFLQLGRSPSPFIEVRAQHDADDGATIHNTTHQPHQSKGTPTTFPFAGNSNRVVSLGCGVAA